MSAFGGERTDAAHSRAYGKSHGGGQAEWRYSIGPLARAAAFPTSPPQSLADGILNGRLKSKSRSVAAPPT